jgi:hypothetical protein
MSNSERNDGAGARTAAEAAEDAALEEFLKRYPGHVEQPRRLVAARSTSGTGMWMRVVAIINRFQLQ